jgi:hypothetical protein
LIEAGVEAPPAPEPAAPPSPVPEREGSIPQEAPPEERAESPMDAVWMDETDDADSDLDRGEVEGEILRDEPFEWMVDSGGPRSAPVSPLDPVDVEPSRLFAEDAFTAEEPAAPQSAGPEPSPVEEDEGWALLGETDERVADDAPTPAEVDIAPPPGYAPPSYWRVVPTSEARRDRPPMGEEDLDTLIREIENAPRIRPDPHFVPPSTFEIEPAAREDEDVVSETLARIYAGQGQFEEAAAVYEKLAIQRPADADTFRERAAEMRDRLRGTSTGQAGIAD